MAINVKIEREEDQSGEIKVKIVPSNPDLKPRTIELVARRAVDGKIMVFPGLCSSKEQPNGPSCSR